MGAKGVKSTSCFSSKRAEVQGNYNCSTVSMQRDRQFDNPPLLRRKTHLCASTGDIRWALASLAWEAPKFRNLTDQLPVGNDGHTEPSGSLGPPSDSVFMLLRLETACIATAKQQMKYCQIKSKHYTAHPYRVYGLYYRALDRWESPGARVVSVATTSMSPKSHGLDRIHITMKLINCPDIKLHSLTKYAR